MQEIKDIVKGYILEEFFPGEKAEALDDTVPLITGGILDSIATVQLVVFLEKRFGVQFEAHEMGLDNLNSLTAIANTVRTKQLEATG